MFVNKSLFLINSSCRCLLLTADYNTSQLKLISDAQFPIFAIQYSKYMIYLILSILSSTLLGFIMTWFEKYKVNPFQAVVVNYFTCVLTGWVFVGEFPIREGFQDLNWFPYAAGISVFFIAGFTVVAYTFQKFGITVTIIISKMSMIISVLFAIIAYHEIINFSKILGILVAIAAIILTNLPHEHSVFNQKKIKPIFWFLPISVILITATIEIVLQFVEQNILVNGTSGDPAFVSTVFLFAGIIGFLIALPGLLTGRLTFSWNNIIGGILLGIPNYFSIYFLMKTLGAGWEGSVVFPINNVAIIALTAIFGGFIIFKEKYTKLNKLGIVLSVVSILLIAYASL
ncbi:MAG: drug/metabolite transporter (DMT)-like permease [Saprospiraceae bacterium]|jgi:drug/metabolite transporter (DMT)-like permease